MTNKKECRERLVNEGLRLTEETERLKETLMWGPTGVEVVLAQLLPTNKSLFFDQFDVLAARAEFDTMADLFQKEGVSVIYVRDELVTALSKSGIEPKHTSIEDLAVDIVTRGVQFADEYGIDNKQILELIYPLLVADAEKYGVKEAILLNETMANLDGLPLANAMFARDQSTVVGDTFIWSKMRKDIRMPEVDVYKFALSEYLSDKKSIEVSGDGRLEGGDVIVNGGICYIGVGGRTNLEGVRQIAPHILKGGLRVMAVYSEARDNGEKNEMDAMHLDTFWMPFSKDQAVCCVEEAAGRLVIEYSIGKSGSLVSMANGNFMDHLVNERGMKVLAVTKEEQEAYAPNFQNLGDKQVVLPLSTNQRLANEFAKMGATVQTAEIFNITRGYGATHCSMAPTVRG